MIVGSGLVEPSKDFRQRLDRKIIELREHCQLWLGLRALWLTEICGVGYQALEVPKIGVWEVTTKRMIILLQVNLMIYSVVPKSGN